MSGKGTWNGAAAATFVTNAAGDILLRMAVTLQVHLMQRLNVSNPRPYDTPSAHGEYLRKRTGWLQAHIVYEPATPAAVAKAGHVRIGYGRSAFYGAVFEVRKTRKGLLDALEEIRPQLSKMGGKR